MYGYWCGSIHSNAVVTCLEAYAVKNGKYFFFFLFQVQVLCVKASEVLGRCMGSLETNLYAFEIPALHVGVISPANVRRFGRHV